MFSVCFCFIHLFLLTCLLRGMTKMVYQVGKYIGVSTHMPLARHDESGRPDRQTTTGFLLTCLLRGMTGLTLLNLIFSKVSTHMPLARHDSGIPKGTYDIKVSTHMPLARHDVLSVGSASYVMWFLLTCLLQGMTCSLTGSAISWMFLLTCLLRGMTIPVNGEAEIFYCFYSHASCEA